NIKVGFFANEPESWSTPRSHDERALQRAIRAPAAGTPLKSSRWNPGTATRPRRKSIEARCEHGVGNRMIDAYDARIPQVCSHPSSSQLFPPGRLGAMASRQAPHFLCADRERASYDRWLHRAWEGDIRPVLVVCGRPAPSGAAAVERF